MTAYVYALLIDGVPRYIGKGSGIPMKRAREHIRTAKRLIKRRAAGEVLWAPNLYNRLAKALAKGCRVEAVCLVSDLTDEQAFERECDEIKRTNGLWNLDSGGLGGRTMGAELRAKLSEAAKRRLQRPGELERLRAFGKSAANLARLKATNAELGRRPESRKKNALAAKARWTDPVKAVKMRAGLRKRWKRTIACPNQLEFL